MFYLVHDHGIILQIILIRVSVADTSLSDQWQYLKILEVRRSGMVDRNTNSLLIDQGVASHYVVSPMTVKVVLVCTSLCYIKCGCSVKHFITHQGCILR